MHYRKKQLLFFTICYLWYIYGQYMCDTKHKKNCHVFTTGIQRILVEAYKRITSATKACVNHCSLPTIIQVTFNQFDQLFCQTVQLFLSCSTTIERSWFNVSNTAESSLAQPFLTPLYPKHFSIFLLGLEVLDVY